MRISTNHCIDYRRKRRLESVSIEEAEFAIAAPEAESPEAAYLERERREMLDGLIDRLPEMYKTPIVLYHKDNLSYQEISEKTREPLSKVKNRIFRGRKMLKELLLMGKGTDAYAL
jgi:RNA polymerase sigma-70 factor (ECF subfamily)